MYKKKRRGGIKTGNLNRVKSIKCFCPLCIEDIAKHKKKMH